MPDPFIGEIRLFAGNFAPDGWAFCDGQLLQIADNDALYQLIGTTYGGDGQSTFALPDLRGRLPVGTGQGAGLTNRPLGQRAGTEAVSLTTAQMPAHTHRALASSAAATTSSPRGAVPAAGGAYAAAPDASTVLDDNLTGGAGKGATHPNLQPSLAVSYIISLFGIFPSQQ